MSRTNKLFVIARGNETREVTFNRYSGVADFSVVAVNPDKAKLEELYGTTIAEEPVYVKDVEIDNNGNKSTVRTVRIDFIISTANPEDANKTILQRATFNLWKTHRLSKDGSKVQVIDKYARTAWVTKEEYKTKAIPTYSSGPANIDSDYMPVYRGQEQLLLFIKALLRIPNVDKWEEIDGVRRINGLIDNPETAEVSLDTLDKIFNGDVSEIRDVVAYQPNNQIRLLFGVRTADNNRQYQALFTDLFLSGRKNDREEWRERDYRRFQKALDKRIQEGAYPNTVFEVSALHVYREKASEIPAAAPGGMPPVFSMFSAPEPAPAPTTENADAIFANATPLDDLPLGD